MKRAIIAFGLSTLVFPGLGQVYNRQKKKGFAIIFFLLWLITALSIHLGKIVYKDVPAGTKIEFTRMKQLLAEEKVKNPRPFDYFNIIFLVLMIYSSADAVFTAFTEERRINNLKSEKQADGQ